MKKIVSLLLIVLLLSVSIVLPIKSSAEEYPLKLDAKSAILMDAATGAVLFEQNADEALPPASVTKIMTLLLVMEAVDDGRIALTDMVTASEKAASMGGSQVFLEVGEQMSVEDMIKCVVISSANDAACALAEHLYGSEEAFVAKMNDRAKELGMNSTHFENSNGLDDTTQNHVCSARDIAIMSRELIKHEKILSYTTIWMDTVRNGAFTLSNTNRLVRFYPGATGLKTGSTSKALFCISATAKRDNLHLIAVIMGSPTRDVRNAEAKKLLDYGFANYSLFESSERDMGNVAVKGGLSDTLPLTKKGFSVLLKKGEEKAIEEAVTLPPYAAAPISAGDTVGFVEYRLNGKVLGKADIVAAQNIEKISYWDIFMKLLKGFFAGPTVK